MQAVRSHLHRHGGVPVARVDGALPAQEPVRRLRQALLAVVAAQGPHAHAHRRTTVPLPARRLRPRLRRQVQPAVAPHDPQQQWQALRLLALQSRLRPEALSAQAPAGGVQDLNTRVRSTDSRSSVRRKSYPAVFGKPILSK